MTTQDLLKNRRATTEQALNLFDSLEPVDLPFMLGSWKGEGFLTDHPMDGLLESYHWYGKRFESPEDVHPLVFSTRNHQLTSVNPALLGPSLSLAKQGKMPKSAAVGKFFHLLLPLLGTSRSRARLRMTTYRGMPSATMIYDQLPINDVFRRIHADSVLGVMDYKGMAQPFFFILHRPAPFQPQTRIRDLAS